MIIDALGPSDLQTAKHLYDDLLHIRDERGVLYVHYRSAPDRATLFSVLEEVRFMCLDGFRPILHFEGHGTEKDGFAVGVMQERVSWLELGAILSSINLITRNNLGVVMAACYGFFQFDAVNIEEPCPFNIFIAPPSEVKAGFLNDRMPVMYRTLFQTRSLKRALECLDKSFIQFHAESFFCLAFASYLKNHCMGRTASTRQENMLTRATNAGLVQNRDRRRELRKQFKALIRKPEEHFYRMARRFLHGQRTVRFQDLEVFARHRGT